MTAPAVTVLMPVYNAARFLADAVDSVLCQSFRDFELLVVNDGSTDRTTEILASYRDPRVRVIDNGRNLGLIPSLNRGLEIAQGEYIARMDQDDVCQRHRLAVQVDFMRSHPDVGLAGAWYRTIGQHKARVVHLPTTHEEITAWLPFHCPIAHPTAFFRRKLFADNLLTYDPNYPHAEDYDLWSRAARIMRLANIPQALLRYRVHSNQVTLQHSSAQSASARLVRGRELARLLPEISAYELDFHQQIMVSGFKRDASTLAQIESWLWRLHEENWRTGAFPEPSFDCAIGRVWLTAGLACMPRGWAWTRYVRSPLTGLAGRRAAAVAGFAARAAKRLVSGRVTRPAS
jgi:hypothetical protein